MPTSAIIMVVTLKNSTIIGISLALVVEAIGIGYFFLLPHFKNPGRNDSKFLIIFTVSEAAAIILGGWIAGAIMKDSTIDNPLDRRNVVFGSAMVAGVLALFVLAIYALSYGSKQQAGIVGVGGLAGTNSLFS